MSRKISRKFAVALCIALVACLSVMATTALAYYTDTSSASGMIRFSVVPEEPDEPHTDVDEELFGLDKVITVRNTSEGARASAAVVRMHVVYPAFAAGSGISINTDPGDGWVKQGDWWYYTAPVEPGASTAQFKVDVEVSEDAQKNLRPFDIVVVQQCAMAQYDDNGHLCGSFVDGEMVTFADGAVVVAPAAVDEEAGE